MYLLERRSGRSENKKKKTPMFTLLQILHRLWLTLDALLERGGDETGKRRNKQYFSTSRALTFKIDKAEL